MKNFKITSLFLTVGLLIPLFAHAGPENFPPDAFDGLGYIIIGFFLLEIFVFIGLILRWLNSRSNRPKAIIDYIVIPYSGTFLIINGFLFWEVLSSTFTPSYKPNIFFDYFLPTFLFIMAFVTTLCPRSWLAKFPTKKTKNT